MTLLLYGIADCDLDAADGGEGVAARRLQATGEDGLVALFSRHEDPPVVTEATLWTFERVIENQMSRHAVLPARFGSMFEQVQDIERALRERRNELTAKFELVRGAVELGVRATWPHAEGDSTPSGPNAGASYMLARVAQGRRAREIAAEMRGALDALARATSYRLLSRPTAPVIASYLVERRRSDELAARVQHLDATMQGVELVCTGPWPPYSFVGEDADG
jgi:hypothetical protein